MDYSKNFGRLTRTEIGVYILHRTKKCQENTEHFIIAIGLFGLTLSDTFT